MFAIIEVHASYDWVDDAECIEAFDTQEQANQKLKEINDDTKAKRDERCEYIENWVDKLEMPDTSHYKEHMEYQQQFRHLTGTYTTPSFFKERLKLSLHERFNSELENYDPPPYVRHRFLYVVEIKEPQ